MASKNFTVRIDEELEDAIRDSANAMGLSVSDYVRLAMTNQNQRKATAILMPCIDGSDRNTTQDESIDTLRQELLELRNAIALQPTVDRNTGALQTELTELRAAIEQGKCETVEMLNVACDVRVLKEQLAANTARMDRNDNTFVRDVIQTLRDDKGYRKLPEQFDRQEERIDRLYAHNDEEYVPKLNETIFMVRELTTANNNNMKEWTKQAKDRESLADAYSKITKSVEHNCDRLVVLEKMNGVVYKSNEVVKAGTGFGKH